MKPATPTAAPATPPELKSAPPVKETGTAGAASPEATSKPGGGEPPSGCGGMDMKFFVPLMVLMVLMYIWMGRSKRKEEKKRKDMLESLKKGDRITTRGGIIGTVIEVRENEVTIKVDETNNTRMKFARWAIMEVGQPKGDTAPEGQDNQDKK